MTDIIQKLFQASKSESKIMAVFYINKCSYGNCDKSFENLPDLIYHIEDAHIDFDPAVLEQKEQQKPQSVPLSYILKFSHTYKESLPVAKENSVNTKKSSLNECKGQDVVKAGRTSTSTESINCDNSSNKHSNTKNFTHYIKATLEHIAHKKREAMKTKKFACPIPGCNKRYKNINGIKYHTKNGHDIKKSPARDKKIYTCHCGKIYKTVQGMKAHCIMHKDVCVNVHESHSPMLSGPKSYMGNHFERTTECIDTINMVKSENDDGILNYSFPNQIPKLSDTIDDNRNMLTPPTSMHNRSILSDNFVDNLSCEEANNSNYSFSFSYQKYP